MWKVIIALLILVSCGKTELNIVGESEVEICVNESIWKTEQTYQIDSITTFKLWHDTCNLPGHAMLYESSRLPNVMGTLLLKMQLFNNVNNVFYSDINQWVSVTDNEIQIYYQDSLRILPIN